MHSFISGHKGLLYIIYPHCGQTVECYAERCALLHLLIKRLLGEKNKCISKMVKDYFIFILEYRVIKVDVYS